MKQKFFVLTLIFISSFVMWAWEMPNRYFEMGIDVEFGVANRSLLGWDDIFNSDKTIKIDLNKLSGDEFGLDFMTGADFSLNYQSKGEFTIGSGSYKIGAGLFSGLEGNAFGSLSRETVDFLVNGNGSASSVTGSVAMGGSVFADVGLRATMEAAGKWKLTVSPSVFIPLFYMEKPDVSYALNNGDPFSGSIIVKSDLYTALLAEDGVSAGEVTSPKGFDISADFSYQLFPFLEVGGAITHIPIVPAFMSSGKSIDKIYTVNESGKSLQELIEDDELDSLLSPEPGEDDLVAFSNGDQAVLRPLRFDAYSVYTPFKIDWLRFSVKPSLGLSFLTVYDTVHFNVGLETKVKAFNMAGLTWDFRYREMVWLNKLDLTLNFWFVELDFGIGFRSMDFPGAFTGHGLYGSFGIRLGY